MTRPGLWAGFSVGLAAVIGNPKAILFYMGALPGFFTLGTLTGVDIALIILISAVIPMVGNLGPGALPGPGAAAAVQPRKLAQVERYFGHPADRRGAGDPLPLTTKSCVKGVTFPPKPL
jgi:threonine/homoserine/homoserine lactone efflux protein